MMVSQEHFYQLVIRRPRKAAEILLKLNENAAFFRCCALSGEVPHVGSEPHPKIKEVGYGFSSD